MADGSKRESPDVELGLLELGALTARLERVAGILFGPLFADIAPLPATTKTLAPIIYSVTAERTEPDPTDATKKRKCKQTVTVRTDRSVAEYTDADGRPCIRITYKLTVSVADECKPAAPAVELSTTSSQAMCGAKGGTAPDPPNDDPKTGDTTKSDGSRVETLAYPDGTTVTVTTSVPDASGNTTVTTSVQWPDGNTDSTTGPK